MRVLIFGTTYARTFDDVHLIDQWVEMNKIINPECDLLLVDSASPHYQPHLCHHAQDGVDVIQLGNNIGHLSRGGQDGWGRAFCAGLQYSIDRGYDYVVHVEGDSLCRQPVIPVCVGMMMRDTLARSVPVRGTKNVETRWVETGLMFLDVRKLETYDIVEQYDWNDGGKKKYPNTPEKRLHDILGLGLDELPWKTQRDDVGILTPDNVHEYDWITHATPEVFDAFSRTICPR